MIILDNLAYQHKEEWEKLGFGIVDAVGRVEIQLNGKTVICRPIAGVQPTLQLFSDVEGSNPQMLPPGLIRERVDDLETVATIDEVVARLNTTQEVKPSAVPTEATIKNPGKEKDVSETENPPDTDSPFL